MQERPWHRSYDDGVPREVDFEEVPLSEWVDRAAATHPDTVALIWLNARISYRQLAEEVNRFATALVGLGVSKGTRVAIQMPNLPQLVIAYYAVLKAGGVVVMTNPLYTPYEVEHQWNDAEVDVAIVMDFLFEQKIEAIRDKLPVQHWILASIPEYLRFPMRQLAPFKLRRKHPPAIAQVKPSASVHRFRDLIRATAPAPLDGAVGIDDLAVLQYTGGTTGISKGAMLSHRNLSCNVQQMTAWYGGVEKGVEVVLAVLPLFHVFGMTSAMNWSVHTCSTIVLQTDPRAIDVLVRNLARHSVTLFHGVPAMFNAVNNYPGVERLDLSSVKSCFSGSAPLPPEVLNQFEKLTGARIIEGFGLSETSPVTHANPIRRTRKIGTVGLPLPSTDGRIVSPDDEQPVAPGEEGELLIKGPQVMQGYWKQPEETARVLRDGWLHTGDLAKQDEDGFFTIVGRTKDMINCSGFKVYPDEVDQVLMAHPAVLETATIGVPHPTRGETVKTFLVLRPGDKLTAEQVQEYCRQHLASYKVPREVEFLDELPKSAVLKILRRELRERELTKRRSQESA
jgi:long-chain acyl-CoA synthetase